MTAWQVYWIFQADKFVNVLAGLGFIGIIAMILAAAICAMESDNLSEKQKTKFVRRWLWSELGLLIFVACSFTAAVFMPSTKTFAAMYIVPKLTSPEAQQFIEKEYAELKDLLRKAMAGDHEDDTDSE